MAQDIVIRGEFLIKDLTDAIKAEGDCHPQIVKAWQDICRQNTDDTDIVYDFNDKADLIECINMGLDAEDIAYLVNQFRDNDNNTQFFNYVNNGISYGLHILEKQDVKNHIENSIESIAYNTLRYPFNSPYRELYDEFVCKYQIELQK